MIDIPNLYILTSLSFLGDIGVCKAHHASASFHPPQHPHGNMFPSILQTINVIIFVL